MRGKRHLAWASATLALGVVGFGLGRLEALPRERLATSAGGSDSPGRSALASAPPEPNAPSSPTQPSPPTRGSEQPSQAPSLPPPRGALRPGTASLWVPPLVNPDALRLVQLVHAFRHPTQPPESLEELADSLLQTLPDDEQRVAFLIAWERYQNVDDLCEVHLTQSAAARPLFQARYGAEPSEENLDRLLGALDYVPDYADLDPNLLAALALDWPDDERPRRLLEAARQARADPPLSSLDERAEARQLGETLRQLELPPRQSSYPEEDPDLDQLVADYQDDPAAVKAWLSSKTGPRWSAVLLLLRAALASEETPDPQALQDLSAGAWRQLQSEDQVAFTRLLEGRPGNSELQRQVLEALAANPDLDLEQVAQDLSPRSRFLLGLASAKRSGWDESPLSILEDHLSLLEEEPFVARRLLPELWKVHPRLTFQEGLRLAEAYQGAGDPQRADEILRRCEPGPQTSAAREHLLGGHSLEQLRDLGLSDE